MNYDKWKGIRRHGLQKRRRQVRDFLGLTDEEVAQIEAVIEDVEYHPGDQFCGDEKCPRCYPESAVTRVQREMMNKGHPMAVRLDLKMRNEPCPSE